MTLELVARRSGLDRSPVAARDRAVAKLAGRPEFEPQPVLLDARRFAAGLQQERADEYRVGGDVEQRALAWTLADRGEGVRGHYSARDRTHPFDRHRQRVTHSPCRFACTSKKAIHGLLSPMSQNGTAETRIGWIAAGLCSGYQRVRERWPGSTSCSKMPRVRASGDPGRPKRNDERLELLHGPRRRRHGLVALLQVEPEEAVGRQRDQIGQFADRGESACGRASRAGCGPCKAQRSSSTACAERDRLATQRIDLVAVLADIGQHRAVGRADEGQRAAAEHLASTCARDQPLRPAQQRGQAARLRLDIDRLVAVDRVHDRRQDRAAPDRRARSRRCGPGVHCIGVRTPLRSPR